ncbi:MAG: lipocalin family protein [Pyrinomonadaceae bacterium]
MSDALFLGNAVEKLKEAAADFFDRITDTFAGEAETLRDGTEFDAVVLPRDLAAHDNAQTEWWYYTGHATTDSGRTFGFEFVFFKRRTDLDRFSVVPLRLIGNPFYFAHFAVTDIELEKFRYAHRKSSNGILDFPAASSEKHYHLRLGDWSIREAAGSHILRATIDDDLIFEATLAPTKPVVMNGEGGVSYKDEGQASRYFSYTRMRLEGDISRGGEVEHFNGQAWMDREFGTWTPTEKQKGWDWFSIQLDNDCELMCYQLRSGSGEISPYSSGTFVDEHGNITGLQNSDFEITPTGEWKSEVSGAMYPSGWQVRVPRLQLELTITPVMRDQELDTRGTTMIVYWEGACGIKASAGGIPVGGNAYVELVGYDRSHDQPNLARFLMGNSLELLAKMIG